VVMLTLKKYELAQALQLDFLRIIPDVGVYVSLAVWLFFAGDGLLRGFRRRKAQA